MSRRTLSLLVVVVMLFSVVPVALPYTAASPASTSTVVQTANQPLWMMNEIMPFRVHRAGLMMVPRNQYERVVGFKFSQMTSSAFREAIANAPFNPLAAQIIVPNGTSSFNASTLPSEKINTLYLPPIGDQGYVGSCNAWSSTYYVWTYMINWWRNNPHPSSTSDIMNPTFTYNLIDGGSDQGSNMWDAMNLISTIGAVPLKDFPVYTYPPFPSDYAWVWPNLTQWMEAPHNSGTPDMYWWQYWWQYYEPGAPELYQIPGQWYILNFTNQTQWNYTKGLLAKGYTLQTAINVLPSFDFLGQPGQFLGYLVFYANYSNIYGQEYWTNGTYASWTVSDLLDYALQDYNLWATLYTNQYYNGNQSVLISLLQQGNRSMDLLTKMLTTEFNISLNEPVATAASKIMNGVYSSYINNQSWWSNATFYLSAYSANGEQWFLNHGFDALFALANFEWMIHYVPLNNYLSRVPYLDFSNYYSAWQGGHAVTIVGYNDTQTTPDGTGAFVMVNSWGPSWGNNGYWLFSYQAIKSAGQVFTTSVDGLLNVSFRIEWPVSWGGSSAFVYVPKAANYTPEVMAVVGIKHPVRGEVVDGVMGSNQHIPAGIPISLSTNGTGIWKHNYLDFWNDYLWSDITNETTAAELPQDHPFPNSPMAFDISNALMYLTYYVRETNSTPRNVTVAISPHDLLRDNITGEVYNFTLLFQTPSGYYPIATYPENVTIPDGGSVSVNVTVPVVQYGPKTAPNASSIDFGNFDVSVMSLIPLEGAFIMINGKYYPLSAEDGGYYFYATGIDQKLSLPAGTYNYTILAVYPNGKAITLPVRSITIKEPLVYIQSPMPTVYNTSIIPVAAKVVDALNITNVTATAGNETIPLTYNSTSGLYEGTFNLTNGVYTLRVTAIDEANNTGKAVRGFIVATKEVSAVSQVSANNRTVNVIVVGSHQTNVSVGNSTMIGVIHLKGASVTVDVPIVNNVPTIMINTTAVNQVASGTANVSLAAGWNTTVNNVTQKETTVKTQGRKKTLAVKITANVNLGETGVAVLAFRNINISKVYVWKNGQKIQLGTDESNPLGYYYTQGNVVFVVLKEDPTVEVDGVKTVTLPPAAGLHVSLATLNFLGYFWYHMYLNQFNELYQKAIMEGFNESSLKQALQYNQTAAEYYKKVLDLSGGNVLAHFGDLRILTPLRKSYLNELKAIEVLKELLNKSEANG
ncbi:C1 family peptidase [Thermococcus sp.]|uniref:C1 family peptidase n=1 Tax=Thermococcus sp. TaxID=35749 RepID=UPI0025D2E351|nr:C1 family peptidase [Thermococcus sp.]